MRKTAILLPLLFLLLICKGQEKDVLKQLYQLETKVIKGDKDALIRMAGYLDDSTQVIEMLGYHVLRPSVKSIALRIIEENLLLLPGEFQITEKQKAKEVIHLLSDPKLQYDELTGCYLMTPLQQWRTDYELNELGFMDQQRIDTTIGINSYSFWYYANQIDGFLAQKRPEALLWIAASWFHNRPRYNRYDFNNAPYLDLIRKLIRADLEVPDKDGTLTPLKTDGIVEDAERLNFLIYWTTHYIDYRWNDAEGYFENILQNRRVKTTIEKDFEKTLSDNNDTAMNAYIRITESDTGEVSRLSTLYDKIDADFNFSSLPTFLYRFTIQTAHFTRYCRDQQLIYLPEGWLLDSLRVLQSSDLTFGRRYQLEKTLAARLTPGQIHAVEYFGLLYEKEWELTYSLGALLDRFYSIHLGEILTDEKQLRAYLKKAALFDRIGIIGICNKYLRKLHMLSPDQQAKIKAIETKTIDPDILESCQFLKKIWLNTNAKKNNSEPDKIKTPVRDFKSSYQAIRQKKLNADDLRDRAADLLGITPYEQIAVAARLIIKDSIFSEADFIRILEDDFGIEASSMPEFFEVYQSRDEKGLYRYFFDKTGIPCFQPNGDFNYEEAYDYLKYGIVEAFVGGGGGRRDNGIYALIKLLELQFKTTLGFDRKLCDVGYPGIVNSPTERARAWMKYLETWKLVSDKSKEPVSISD